ncbi:MAG: M15 family metallopeptidase [Pseudomonadota bacterium]
MDRRDFLKVFSAGTAAAVGGHLIWRAGETVSPVVPLLEDIPAHPDELAEAILYLDGPGPDLAAYLETFQAGGLASRVETDDLDGYLEKMHNFEAEHFEDVFLSADRYAVLLSTFKRMDRVQSLVGHGNFNVLAFDDMLNYSRRYESVGAFPAEEENFLEEIFSENAQRYGFLGNKVITELTARVPERDTVRIASTGHFLFKGDSLALYRKVQKDVGGDIVLTSGIRSIVKQTYLFLAKTIQSKGNLSRASRSLAPPGHSFHGIGDFDVGKAGFGTRNFTADFARTDEFRRLLDLGYVDMRYPEDNLLGVRYEPWHIKVV